MTVESKNDGAEHRRAEFLLRPWSLADRMSVLV